MFQAPLMTTTHGMDGIHTQEAISPLSISLSLSLYLFLLSSLTLTLTLTLASRTWDLQNWSRDCSER